MVRPDEAGRHAAEPVDRGAAQLLIVEDDDAMRELLVEEMTDAGFRVVAADGGTAGIERAKQGDIDLVITDLRMPDLDGFDLIRDIRATDRPPHIVMITAFGSIETAIKAVKLGAYDYITKPFEIEELVLVSDKAIRERKLVREVERLRREVKGQYQLGNIIGKSQPMQEVFSLVQRLGPSTASVLVTGESGTGKELIAHAIHHLSPRSNGPFVAVNLAAIPETLIEAELFGYKRGAFTDARNDKTGLFAEADGGTIFLDEIGELAAGLQAKLLRVLQEREIRPLGATRQERIDVRVVAATNKVLEDLMREGSFREDLYYRLNVIQIALPPLRARPDDIIPLAEHFLHKLTQRIDPPRSMSLSAEAQRTLLSVPWPGNVRELENVIERCVTLATCDEISADDLPQHVRERRDTDFLAGAVARRLKVSELEREYIMRVLEDEGGNKTRAALRLGLDRKTLYRKLEDYSKRGGGE